MSKKESAFQAGLIKELKTLFPGCVVAKTDPTYVQGFPDLMVLHGRTWALLECKRDSDSSHRPNQDYYVDILNKMSYSSFVCPENKEQVLDELQRTFGVSGTACLFERK